jgi:rubrerythrin
MYPEFQQAALLEKNHAVEEEMRGQIQESQEHAEQFKQVLAKAEKRFAALKKVEQRHASAYQKMLEEVQ